MREVEGDPVVVVAEGVEMARDRSTSGRSPPRRPRTPPKRSREPGEHLAAALAADGEEALDAVDLVGRQAEAGDGVARTRRGSRSVSSCRTFSGADLVELVEDAEDVDAALPGDAGEGEQEVQDARGSRSGRGMRPTVERARACRTCRR